MQRRADSGGAVQKPMRIIMERMAGIEAFLREL
jgi:hypothetical protein